MQFAIERRSVDTVHDWVGMDVEKVVGRLVHMLGHLADWRLCQEDFSAKDRIQQRALSY